MGSGIAQIETQNSRKNKLDPEDRKFHDWYRFILSYPPHLVRQYITEFNLTSEDIVLDPFCGTGTTLVECMLHNVPSIGIEANPFAHFASSVKTNWNVNAKMLIQRAEDIKEQALETIAFQGISDNNNEAFIDYSLLHKLNGDQEKIILKDSISPLPLHKLLVLLDKINEHNATPYHKHLLLALGNALVYEISNLRFGPEVGVGKIKKDAVVIGAWYKQVKKIYNDLYFAKQTDNANSKIILSDSRNLKALLNGKKISAVITSPPYPNEKDYTRTTRIESVVLGFINNNDELRAFKKTLLRSNTRGVYKGDDDDKYVINFKEIQNISNEIENKRIELGKTSGFERLYHKVAKLYFGGIAKHLSELKHNLKPGAQLAYVVGDQASYLRVMIRTGEIIGDIAQSLGYELVRIDLFRTRFSTATKTNLNEEVVILRWKG